MLRIVLPILWMLSDMSRTGVESCNTTHGKHQGGLSPIHGKISVLSDIFEQAAKKGTTIPKNLDRSRHEHVYAQQPFCMLT